MSLRFAISKFFLLLAFASSLTGGEEIRVELPTRQKLSGCYLSKVDESDSPLSPSYLKTIRKVLEFDLHYSGYAKILPTDELLEKALRHHDPSVAFSPVRWGKSHAEYVFKSVVHQKQLDFYAFEVATGRLKKFEGIPLSGVLNMDRRQMHKLANALLDAFFGVEGICHSRILYSLQMENPNPSSKDWKSEIWECDWDGENPRQLL